MSEKISSIQAKGQWGIYGVAPEHYDYWETKIPPIQTTVAGRNFANEEAAQPGVWNPIVAPVKKWSTRLESGCPACVAKHLSQAILQLEMLEYPGLGVPGIATLLMRAVILNDEATFGYAGHKWLAMGCLAEAEHLLLREGIVVDAQALRHIRLLFTPGGTKGSLYFALRDEFLSKQNWRNPETEARAFARAHLQEAHDELPRSDSENRGKIEALFTVPFPDINDFLVPELSRILKSVTELYCLDEVSNG